MDTDAEKSSLDFWTDGTLKLRRNRGCGPLESFSATVFIFRKHCCGMFAKISLEPTALEIYFKSEST